MQEEQQQQQQQQHQEKDQEQEQEFTKKINNLFLSNYNSLKKYKHLYNNQQIMNNICYIDENNLIIQYSFFKKFGNKNNYHEITQLIINNINSILIKYDLIDLHFSLHKMDLLDLEKHYDFLINICKLLQHTYPDKLNKFNIYQAPYIYSKIYSIISTFIDKTTRSKIKLV